MRLRHANLYGYVLGDPVNFVDPEGMFLVPIAKFGIKYSKVVWNASKQFVKDIKVEGAGGGGRVCQVRYKKLPVGRIDYAPIPGSNNNKRLHLHLDKWFPGVHIPLDPRSYGEGNK